MAGWERFASGIFADGTYGAGWNGVGAASYLGAAGQGVTGLTSWRQAAVCQPVVWRYTVCDLGIWSDLWGFLGREQSEVDARYSRG